MRRPRWSTARPAKTRTRVGVAVILGAGGPKREAIARDYALSLTCLGPNYLAETREWVVENRGCAPLAMGPNAPSN